MMLRGSRRVWRGESLFGREEGVEPGADAEAEAEPGVEREDDREADAGCWPTAGEVDPGVAVLDAVEVLFPMAKAATSRLARRSYQGGLVIDEGPLAGLPGRYCIAAQV
jgi:hypothetical protein